VMVVVVACPLLFKHVAADTASLNPTPQQATAMHKLIKRRFLIFCTDKALSDRNRKFK